MHDLRIRETVPEDWPVIAALHRDGFPDEDLAPLVRALLEGAHGALSLAAIVAGALKGHVIFTPCGLSYGGGEAFLLGPLVVDASLRGRGVGSALVRAGLRWCEHDQSAVVCVLGDPAYYGRFGFKREDGVAPPYALPAQWREAWRAIRFGDAPPPKGVLMVPKPWRRPALWLP